MPIRGIIRVMKQQISEFDHPAWQTDVRDRARIGASMTGEGRHFPRLHGRPLI
jgi:hypothetical protein